MVHVKIGLKLQTLLLEFSRKQRFQVSQRFLSVTEAFGKPDRGIFKKALQTSFDEGG